MNLNIITTQTAKKIKTYHNFTDCKSSLTLRMSGLLLDSDDLRSDWLPLGSGRVSSSIKAAGATIWKQHLIVLRQKKLLKPLKWKYNFEEFYLIKIWELNQSKWRRLYWCLHKQRRSQWIGIIRGKPLYKLFFYGRQLVLVKMEKSYYLNLSATEVFLGKQLNCSYFCMTFYIHNIIFASIFYTKEKHWFQR